MEQMKRRIALAAFLGLLLGLAVGYSPTVQPTAAPRSQLAMQPFQSNVAQATLQPGHGPNPLLIALLAGLLLAIPVFLLARRRAG
jgi:hypothetical protein